MKKFFDKISGWLGLIGLLALGGWVCEFLTRKQVNRIHDSAKILKLKAEVEAERKTLKIKKDGGSTGIANDSADLLDE